MTQIDYRSNKYDASKNSIGELEDIYVQTQFFNSEMIAKWRFGWLESFIVQKNGIIVMLLCVEENILKKM